MKCKDRVKRKEKKKDFELETRAKKEHSTSVQLCMPNRGCQNLEKKMWSSMNGSCHRMEGPNKQRGTFREAAAEL